MEMHLQPLAHTCFVSGAPFVDGVRVASYLVRSGAALEIVRYDLLETQAATLQWDVEQQRFQWKDEELCRLPLVVEKPPSDDQAATRV